MYFINDWLQMDYVHILKASSYFAFLFNYKNITQAVLFKSIKGMGGNTFLKGPIQCKKIYHDPPHIHNYQAEVTESLLFLELFVHLSYLWTCTLRLPSFTAPGYQLIVKLHLVQRRQFFSLVTFLPIFS